MTSPSLAPETELLHPLDAHAVRTSVNQAAVAVVVVAEGPPEARFKLAGELRARVAASGREAAVYSAAVEHGSLGSALQEVARQATQPILLVSRTLEPWQDQHFLSLFSALEKADHVVGRRPATRGGRIRRWLANLPWRWLMAVPVADPHSPCQAHRREKLAEFPLQSRGDFVDIELLAKATFLGHIIDEAEVPPIARPAVRHRLRDIREVMKRPVFVRPPQPPSAPLEDAQGEQKSEDGPGREDRQRPAHVDQAGSLEHDAPEGRDELGER